MDGHAGAAHTALMARNAATASLAPTISLFDLVRTTEAVRGLDRDWPPASRGTVVEVLRDGEAYMVEFTNPSDVATVYARQLTAA